MKRSRRTFNQAYRHYEREFGWWWGRNESGFYVGVTTASLIIAAVWFIGS